MKLAIVCQGRASPSFIDSYEIERRPGAQAIVASGEEIDHAQLLTDPAERRLHDEALREKFAKSSTRHSEAVAEAELGIDYGASPIVMGGKHKNFGTGLTTA